jgi:cytochrome c-type biogenesis protein CcmH
MSVRHPPHALAAARLATARLAAALLLGALALAGALAPSARAQERPLDRQVFEIANELRCPTCVSESVGQSSSAIAREMRTIIQEQLEAGATRGEILAFFQARYGDWILLDPPKRGVNLVVWLLPVAAALGGVTLLGVLLRRWRAAGAAPVQADPEDVARVRAQLGRTPDPSDDPGEEPDPSWRR